MNDVTTMDPRDIADQRPTNVAVQDLTGRAPAHSSINHGAVAIEQERAIAEVQGQIIIAQRCPRDVVAATAEFLEACKMADFASKAFYTVPNRGSGPSIRFAEEAARCYGNFQFGHRELSRSEGKSEVEVYAWDVQKNNRSTRQITVMHYRDKRGGPPVLLTDQADIDNRIANVASKQMRGRILALLPKAMVAAGEAMAKKTLAGDNTKPLSARIMDMTQAFADTYGVSVAMLETYIGHSLEKVTIDELADMGGVFNALREGAKVSEYFNADGEVADNGADRNSKLDEAAARGRQRAAKKTEPAPDDQKTSDDKKVQDKKPDQKTDEKSEQKAEPKTKTDQQADRQQSEQRQQDRREQSDQREQPREDRDDRQQERRDPPREEQQRREPDQREERRDPPRDEEQREQTRDDDRRDPRDDQQDRRDPRDDADRDAPPPRDEQKPRRESVF